MRDVKFRFAYSLFFYKYRYTNLQLNRCFCSIRKKALLLLEVKHPLVIHEGFGVTKSNLAYVELYLTNQQEYFESVMGMFMEYIGEHRPAGSSIGVTYLAFPEQLIEVRAVAHTD